MTWTKRAYLAAAAACAASLAACGGGGDAGGTPPAATFPSAGAYGYLIKPSGNTASLTTGLSLVLSLIHI